MSDDFEAMLAKLAAMVEAQGVELERLRGEVARQRAEKRSLAARVAELEGGSEARRVSRAGLIKVAVAGAAGLLGAGAAAGGIAGTAWADGPTEFDSSDGTSAVTARNTSDGFGVSAYSSGNFGILDTSDGTAGVVGSGASGHPGVAGLAGGALGAVDIDCGVYGFSASTPGVRGDSSSGAGVLGTSASAAAIAGVTSQVSPSVASGQNIGVLGAASQGKVGVKGISDSASGVYGVSTSGSAVRGDSTSSTGVLGTTAGSAPGVTGLGKGISLSAISGQACGVLGVAAHGRHQGGQRFLERRVRGKLIRQRRAG